MEKEIRLGNYALNENNQIVQFDETRMRILFKGEIKYKPIPLTEEWLVKFGFVKDKIDNTYYNDNFTIFLPNFFKYKDSHLRKFKYVHELQNVFFALEGEELIIKTK
jgi:hypothetical protein